MKNLFTTITLSNGDKLEIVELTTGHLMAANNSQQNYNNKIQDELDHLAIAEFIIQQICFLNGKRQSIEYFKSLTFKDYSRVIDCVSALVVDIPKFF